MTQSLLSALTTAKLARPVRVLGIDLGTTNSAVAVLDFDPKHDQFPAPYALEVEQTTDEGPYTNVTVPSVVAVRGEQHVVGKGAKDLRGKPGFSVNRTVFYETKNYMGTSRTFPSGEGGLHAPRDVAESILRFLAAAAERAGIPEAERIVVTVPASFNTAQRADTIAAASQAGLTLASGDLLDEPVAAFLDILMTRGPEMVARLDQPRVIVVFDFGGGTCDIALFRVMVSGEGTLDVSPLTVSRYHRLGGGDIDAGIVHDVLLAQLLTQNSLATFDLSWSDKKQKVEPALLAVAEALKIKMSKEVHRLRGFGRTFDGTRVVQPGTYPVPLGNRTLVLRDPFLDFEAFERIIAPLIDEDALYPVEDEFRSIQSIFLPLNDALDRAMIKKQDVAFCLPVGGSSLLLPVQDALKNHLPQTELLVHDEEFMQIAIARGAAWHAFALATTGQGLIRSVVHDDLSIRTVQGLQRLVPSGSTLPFPSEQLEREYTLGVPKDVPAKATLPLRLELVGGEDRVLTTNVWNLQGPLKAGAPLKLRASMDLSAVLHLDLHLGEQSLALTLENPNTHVVNPGEERAEIEEIELSLRQGQVTNTQLPKVLDRLARLYGELDQNEHAIELMEQSLRVLKRPDAYKLNMLGTFNDRIKNYDAVEKRYREAAQANPRWNGPLFNLALSLKRRGDYHKGLSVIQEALDIERDIPELTLAVDLAGKAGDASTKVAYLADLKQVVLEARVEEMEAFEFGWALTAANLLGDKALKERVERAKRLKKHHPSSDDDQFLPTMKSTT